MEKRKPYIYGQIKAHKDGNRIQLVCGGKYATKRQAKSILKKLFTMWHNQVLKGELQEVNADDVFPTVKKFIDEKSLTFEEAKTFCLKHCSEYVFNYELEKISN